ncbi:hypothetical protein M2318_004671 [Metapseudomonas resinovorans]
MPNRGQDGSSNACAITVNTYNSITYDAKPRNGQYFPHPIPTQFPGFLGAVSKRETPNPVGEHSCAKGRVTGVWGGRRLAVHRAASSLGPMVDERPLSRYAGAAAGGLKPTLRAGSRRRSYLEKTPPHLGKFPTSGGVLRRPGGACNASGRWGHSAGFPGREEWRGCRRAPRRDPRCRPPGPGRGRCRTASSCA